MQFHFDEECNESWKVQGDEFERVFSRYVNLNARGEQG